MRFWIIMAALFIAHAINPTQQGSFLSIGAIVFVGLSGLCFDLYELLRR